MPGVRRRLKHWPALAAPVFAAAGAALLIGMFTGASATPGPAPAPAAASVRVLTRGPATPVPASYLGLSTEYWTLPIWEQRMPVLERVLAQLHASGDGPFILRIGGDSADHAFWEPPGQNAPDWAYEVTPSWLAGVARLVRETGGKVILDLNLVTATPHIAAQWAAAAVSALPAGSLIGFEVGNEPDIYTRTGWMSLVKGAGAADVSLPLSITAARYTHEFLAYAQALERVAPGVPLLGPALANPIAHSSWIRALLDTPHPGLAAITVHRYPYSACAFAGTPAFPTVGRVLSPAASSGLAHRLITDVRLAHSAGLGLRLTELNSVTCGGRAGVSDTFATALWAPDALFNLMHAGVDGVNVHVREYTINAAFALTRHGVLAHPLFYGLALFARTLGPAARLVPVSVRAPGSTGLVAWAVRTGRSGLHVLLIDKGQTGVAVALHVPASRAAVVQRLLAPSVLSRGRVTLAGQTLSAQGRWRGPRVESAVLPLARDLYRIVLPAGSAALVWVPLNPPAPPVTRSAGTRRAARPRGAPPARRAARTGGRSHARGQGRRTR
jgi:hypothetical protein